MPKVVIAQEPPLILTTYRQLHKSNRLHILIQVVPVLKPPPIISVIKITASNGVLQAALLFWVKNATEARL